MTLPDRTFRPSATARSRSGQSLIEFTLVMPFLLIVATGMLSFGITLHDYLCLTYGTNMGVQTLTMSRGVTSDPCATAYTAFENAAPGLTNPSISISFVINGNSYSGTSCTSASADMVQGSTAQMTATYPCTLAVYGLNAPGCTLGTKSAEMIQ
ncbi:MAG: pilus assembly protein [Acidobacteriota bacterium]|nr:pilus assembly protein [Acidobacteriota bacterium]